MSEQETPMEQAAREYRAERARKERAGAEVVQLPEGRRARRRPDKYSGTGRARHVIEVQPGETDAATDAAVAVLRTDPNSFDYGGQLSTVERGSIYPMGRDAASYHLGGRIDFRKWDGRAKDFCPCDPPAELVGQVLALGERRRLKPLDAVITAPTIRLDGSILDQPGYDAATRLVLDPAGPLPPVIEHPTIEQARDALNVLMAPFDGFPFVDAAARGALLSATITAAVRAVLPTSPAFGLDAPLQGAGKTLLASCVGALMNGCAPDIWPHVANARDDEETRKRLFSALRAGAKVVVWDNITGTFDSASMAAFITGAALVDRVLGKSEADRVPNRAMLILTGNNLTLGGDMPRRVITCRIDPHTPEPFARQFDLDPLAHCLAHRAEMIAAACTLIRARFTHATRRAPGRLASFEAWDDLVRQTVCWCNEMLEPGGFGDPMDLIREAQGGDPEGEALLALLDALRARFGKAEFGAKEIMAAMNTGGIPDPRGDEIRNALVDLANERSVGTTRGIGRVLRFREGRIAGGVHLTSRTDSHRGTRIFRVREAECGFGGFSGFNPPARAKLSPDSDSDSLEGGRGTNPQNPPNPHPDPDAFDPGAW